SYRGRPPVAQIRHTGLADAKVVAGPELPDAAQNGQRRRHGHEREVVKDRFRIDRVVDVVETPQRLQLRRETDFRSDARVVQRLLAEAVARENEDAGIAIPERECEHAVYECEPVDPVTCKMVQQHLSVTVRFEDNDFAAEIPSKVLEVIDFAVEYDSKTPVRRGHRLVTAGEIDDRKPTHSERNTLIGEAADIVRSPMCQRRRSARDL